MTDFPKTRDRLGKGPFVARFRLKLPIALAICASLWACKKDEPAPAVVEETPPAEVNTDTSSVMPEEPALSQFGHSKKGGMTNGGNAAAPAGIVQNGRYVVQVSVFKRAKQASRLVEKLAAQGYPAYVTEVQDPTPELSGSYHRVRIGTFHTLADARSFGGNTLQPLGYDFWVDKKSMDHVGGRGESGYSSGSGSSSGSSSPASSYATPAPEYTPPPLEPEPAYSAPSVPTPSSSVLPEPPAPAEPIAPPSDAWGTPAPEVAPEPPAPPSSNWGTPTDPAAPATPAEPAKAPADSSKKSMDDW